MIRLPDVVERQKPDASNAGLERGYLNMSAVSLTARGVQRTFRVDRKPKDLLFFDDVWEFINYLANSLLFLLIGFELALTNLAQSFPGIFFGLLGAVIMFRESQAHSRLQRAHHAD